MKLRADRTEFAEAVLWATRTVGARVTLPALSGVLLDAIGVGRHPTRCGWMSGDHDRCFSTLVPEAF